MNNVGDTKTFTISGGASDGSITYVWKFWDNSVQVTTEPTVEKVLNEGGTGLGYSCTYCDALGQSATLTGSLDVNAPPVIVGTPTISVNDALFPFNTILTSICYDPENS